MSDPKPIKKRGRLVKMLMLGGGAIALAGGGAAGGMYLGKPSGGGKVQAKTEEEPDEAAESHYYAMEQPFTVNLQGSEAFIQTSLAVSSRGDAKVTEAVKANEPAMRSVALQLLAEQDHASLASAQGRRALLKKLRIALDAELKQKVGFGGIDSVYFTTFVMQ